FKWMRETHQRSVLFMITLSSSYHIFFFSNADPGDRIPIEYPVAAGEPSSSAALEKRSVESPVPCNVRCGV
ncbi:hypothetical protein, partial [Salmonella enterica]|uniref:hypothetical protein n=1 Tax=Salmonella enterica TaxID=28901 RepID=UPI0020C2107D